ncbi:DNA-directed RNA polymerase I subunit RPA49-like, partial [Oxyura jamaicensis]|uniref:DNA-directed RNA polymerase I subunit RPA49-like n=1 Tax=Oxyura jamaicensis TaxID=8884 RepID=UPI0015A50C8F
FLPRYFVGVLNKGSGQMEVYNAEIFNMQPLLSVGENFTRLPQLLRYDGQCLSSYIHQFPQDLQMHLLRENILLWTVLTRQERRYSCSLLQNFFKILPVLSPAEFEALKVPAAAFVNITPEEITKKTEEKSHCSFVLEELKFLPVDEKSRDHKARCLWFLDVLIKFSFLKVIKKKHPMGPECPHIISRKLMKNFTSLTYNNGSVQNLVSASMKTKITAYVIALALHINKFQIDLTILQNDMKLQESRMMDIAKAMRLKISKAKGLPGLENDQNHKLGTLSLPLPAQKTSGNQRKRKKMN